MRAMGLRWVLAQTTLEMITVTGPTLYALLMPGLIAAVVGIEVFQALLDEPLFHYELPPVEKVRVAYLVYAVTAALGANSTAVATGNALVATLVDPAVARSPAIARPTAASNKPPAKTAEKPDVRALITDSPAF